MIQNNEQVNLGMNELSNMFPTLSHNDIITPNNNNNNTMTIEYNQNIL
jgi:hypothetical protein